MKVIISTKNFNASDNLKDVLEKKMAKLGKYFSEDIDANVMISNEHGKQKVETTINARGMIFRAEETTNDVYDSIDRVVDKLSVQMSRFKTKLQKKNADKSLLFDSIPEMEEEEHISMDVVKKKKFDLEPMTTEEAIIRMEMLQHTFFIFLNMETDSVNVVYKRKDGGYGLLETSR